MSSLYCKSKYISSLKFCNLYNEKLEIYFKILYY